jgi:hypothetical protein
MVVRNLNSIKSQNLNHDLNREANPVERTILEKTVLGKEANAQARTVPDKEANAQVRTVQERIILGKEANAQARTIRDKEANAQVRTVQVRIVPGREVNAQVRIAQERAAQGREVNAQVRIAQVRTVLATIMVGNGETIVQEKTAQDKEDAQVRIVQAGIMVTMVIVTQAGTTDTMVTATSPENGVVVMAEEEAGTSTVTMRVLEIVTRSGITEGEVTGAVEVAGAMTAIGTGRATGNYVLNFYCTDTSTNKSLGAGITMALTVVGEAAVFLNT